MNSCCTNELKHLKKHRDVARCDTCQSLLLAYDNRADFEATQQELTHHDVLFELEEIGELFVIIKHG